MKSKGSTQVKNAEQRRNDAAVFFRLLSEAQQALVQFMAAAEVSTAEQAAFCDVLAKLQAQITDYLDLRIPASLAVPELLSESVPELISESILDKVHEQSSDLSELSEIDSRILAISNRALRKLLITSPDIRLGQYVSEQDIQLFNIFFEKNRRKALADLGLNNLSEDQITEIEESDAEILLLEQLQNKALEQILITLPGSVVWGITQDQITELNTSLQASDQRDVLADIGLIDIPQLQWAKIIAENARIQCLQELDNWFFKAVFASFPELQVQTDEEGDLTEEAQDAIYSMQTIYAQPVLKRNEFEGLLDTIGLQHDWLDTPAELTGVLGISMPTETSQSWWECFEADYQRARAAYYFVDPTLRAIIISDPKYRVQEPVDMAALAIINQAKSTILRGEYLAALRLLVPRLILSSAQFEQVTAFLQALEYLKKSVSIEITAKIDAAENTFNNIKNQPITHVKKLEQIQGKIELIKKTLDSLEQSFIEDLTQDVVDITFFALDSAVDIQNIFPDSVLRKFFPLRKNIREYQQEIAEIEQQGILPDAQNEAISPEILSLTASEPPKVIVETQVSLIPAYAAAAIQLSRNEKWEGLLAQTEEAVQQVAERFGWEGVSDPKNPDQTLYTYANDLKIVYSKKGISYYERNLDDAHISEELQQKEKELAYAWVELVRPSILVEPVLLLGNSQGMIGELMSEFTARRIHTAIKTDDKSPRVSPSSSGNDKKKGFFQTLTDATRRLDQFGRYLDKGK